MKHPLVFLIGMHGVGKSTVGSMLTGHGFRHISLGDLGRLVRHKRVPRGYSLRFLRRLAAHIPGERMSAVLIETLLAEIGQINRHGPVVVDGYPAEPDQVLGLPAGSTVIHLVCSDSERVARLTQRSEQSKRKWTPGRESSRDRVLAAVARIAHDNERLNTHVIASEGDPVQVANKVMAASLARKLPSNPLPQI